MKVIARPLGTGKTRELLETALEDDGTVLTTTKRALQVKAESYGFDSIDIIDLNDLMYGNYDSTKPLYIHKLEDVMQEILNADFDSMQLKGFSIRLGD